MPDAPLTPTGHDELHKHALLELFDELSFAGKVRKIAAGLRQPRDSGAHKWARLQMLRLWAPAAAVGVPLLAILLLMLLAAVTRADKPPIIIRILPTEEPLILEPPKPVPLEPSTTSEMPSDIAVTVNTPTPILPDASLFQPTPGIPMDRIRAPIKFNSPFGARGGDANSGPGFGYQQGTDGDLVGVMYDLKRDARGRARQSDYYADLKDLVRSGFSKKITGEFYRLPQQLYLSHLFVPRLPANEGPKAFAVDALMEPTRWVAHYSGTLNPANSGCYRFVGPFDDALIILVDGKVVLDTSWPYNAKPSPLTGWTPYEHVGAHASFSGQTLAYGDWMTLESGVEHRLEFIIGECPGGVVGGVILVQERDTVYRKGKSGRPILPVFASTPLSQIEKQRLADCAEFEFDDSVPVMNLTRRQREHLSRLRADAAARAIQVTVEW